MSINLQQILVIYFHLTKEMEGKGPKRQSEYKQNLETKMRKRRERQVHTRKTDIRRSFYF